LESDALPIGATDPCLASVVGTRQVSIRLDFVLRLFSFPVSPGAAASDFAFSMQRMSAAARAELLDGELVGLLLLVLGGGVVAPFASIACKADQVSHLMTSWFRLNTESFNLNSIQSDFDPARDCLVSTSARA
jgi:hypothetical protein